MYSRKRNQADGHVLPFSVPPKRLSFDMQHPEAESMMSSLDSERSCVMQRNFSPHADDNTSPADCKYSVVAVGKRLRAHHQRIVVDAEEKCSKRSRIEYSDATVSGVTYQNDSNLYHARLPDAESGAASVGRHVGSCHDSVCLNSRRSKFVATCTNETDVDTRGIRRKDADKHVTFISSRVEERKGSMLSVAMQGSRDTSVSSISSSRQSSNGSHSNSRITSFSSHVRDPSQASPTHGQKSEAGARGGLVSSKHVIKSPQISSAGSRHVPFLNVDTMRSESRHTSFFNVGTMRLKSIPADTMHQHASFLNVDTMRSKGSPVDTMPSKGLPVDTMPSKGLPVDTMCSKDVPPSYVLSSGRLCLEQEARLGRRLPTIDDDFEEYFSSLML